MKINAVNIKVRNMNSYQENRARIAASMVLEFYASDFFRMKLLNTNLDELRGESKSSITKRVSSVSLYQIFMTGKEEWNNSEDYEIDLIVTRYRKNWSKVKGYIIPMKPTIHVNAKYFDTATVLDIASNLCHEYSHTVGLTHSGKYLRESLPYLINEWVQIYFASESPITEHLNNLGDGIKTKRVCKRVWYKLWLGKTCYTKVIK